MRADRQRGAEVFARKLLCQRRGMAQAQRIAGKTARAALGDVLQAFYRGVKGLRLVRGPPAPACPRQRGRLRQTAFARPRGGHIPRVCRCWGCSNLPSPQNGGTAFPAPSWSRARSTSAKAALAGARRFAQTRASSSIELSGMGGPPVLRPHSRCPPRWPARQNGCGAFALHRGKPYYSTFCSRVHRALSGAFFWRHRFPTHSLQAAVSVLLSNFIHILPVISKLPQGHIT